MRRHCPIRSLFQRSERNAVGVSGILLAVTVVRGKLVVVISMRWCQFFERASKRIDGRLSEDGDVVCQSSNRQQVAVN